MMAAEPPQMADTHQTQVLHALAPDACKTLKMLSGEVGLTHVQVSRAASSLIRKGLVERLDIGRYRLTRNGERAVAAGIAITSGPNAPFKAVRRPMRDTLRQRAWTAMRIQRSFTIADLLVASSHGTERNAASNLQRYLKALAGAYCTTTIRGRNWRWA